MTFGCCSSPKPTSKDADDNQIKVRSAEIDKQAIAAVKTQKPVVTLLLLGTGASGKSTLFKQLITIHGKGHSQQVRLEAKKTVHKNILTAIQTLIQRSGELPAEFNTKMLESAMAVKDAIMRFPIESPIDETMAQKIAQVWNDSGIQNTYAHRAKFQLDDGAAYLLDRVVTASAPDYIPNDEDLLRVRVRTTGITETLFDYKGKSYRMLDVGGQRNERKKWIHCFQGVTAVIFVVAISEYDQVIFEDHDKNSLMEALDLFGEICNSEWFTKTSIVLFFNKSDLFQEKIQNVDMSVTFPDYTGGNNYDNGIAYLKSAFLKKNSDPGRCLYVHVTCATNRNNVALVFDSVSDTILSSTLSGGGLL
ncbi:G-protein alpha subunit [Plasmodiophora brassicae]